MARAIDQGQVTPADELRDLLTINEKRAVNQPGGMPVADLLCDLDRIAELWPQLEAQGVDLRPEAGRWHTLQAAVRRNARQIVRQARAAGGFQALRQRCGRAEAAAWWWTLDEQLRAQDRRRRLRAISMTALVLAVVVGLYFLIGILFPVDPNVRAATEATNAGERKIVQEGDFAGAAVDFQRAAEAMPGQPDNWMRLGAALQKVGDAAGAEVAFQQAQALLTDEAELRVLRASVFIAFGMLDEAEADLQVAQRLAPDEPMVYLNQANVFEARQDYPQALAALERANMLADAAGQADLIAITRYRMGILMQQAQIRMAIPATPTP